MVKEGSYKYKNQTKAILNSGIICVGKRIIPHLSRFMNSIIVLKPRVMVDAGSDGPE